MTALAADRPAGRVRRLLTAGWPRRLAAWLFARGRLAGLVVLALLLALRWWDPAPVEVLRLKTFDLLQRLFPLPMPERTAVIVDIDEASLRALGQWPWPRNLLAQLVINLHQAGVPVVGFDMIFPEPDRLSPARIAEQLPGLDEAARESLRRQPSHDAVFAEVMRQGRVVIGRGTQAGPADGAAPRGAAIATIGADPRPHAFAFPGLVTSHGELEEAADGHGVLSLVPEQDGIVRRIPTVLRIGDRLYPSLGVEMLRVATGQSAFAVRTGPHGIEALVVARTAVPVDPAGRLWLRAEPHDPGRYLSALSVLTGEFDPTRLQGKLALVGASAAGLQDIRATPLERSIPGVEIQAQALDSILNGLVLQRPAEAATWEMLAALLAGLVMVATLPALGPRWTLLAVLAVVGTVLIASTQAYGAWSYLIDPSFPLIATAVVYLVLAYTRFASEDRQRRQLRRAFGQYVSPSLVAQIVRDPARVKLGGETRTMTFMFCDVRGFTAVSEQFKADPAGLTRLINRFLTPMTSAVMTHGGTVDKYIGDCIMAFWNAPMDDPAHAANACRAALAMQEALRRLNLELRAEAFGGGIAREDLEEYEAAKRLSLGSGGVRDQEQAVAMFLREAEHGYANAQYSLAKAYRDGAGVARDPVAAARWFRAAAEQGYAKAQRHLGNRYARGEGVEKDELEALRWLTLAAREGLAAAEEVRSELADQLPQSQVTAAEQWARTWRPKVGARRAIKLEIGLGINTGECIVGNMGSNQRFDYSVLGDAVNLAARLEAQSKNYGVPVILGEETRRRADGLATIELDLLAVKGKREATRIFALLGDESLADSAPFCELTALHQAMLDAYRSQRWAEALHHLEAARSIDYGLDELYDLYARRIREYQADPPAADWDGVYVARSK